MHVPIYSLMYGGLGLQVVAEAARLTGRLAMAPGYGLAAIGTFSQMAAMVFARADAGAALSAAFTAYYLNRWWHGGGGAGTRRRLRALRERFLGTRRTAPAVA